MASGYPSADCFTFQSVSKAAFNNLLTKLTSKYGPEPKSANETNENSGLGDHRIMQGSRYVAIGFAPTQNGCTRMTITYIDSKLKKQADNETNHHEAEPGLTPDPVKPQSVDKSDL
jgi:hypothetical protein